MNLPNRLTLLRIVLIPVFVVFFSLNYVKAALVVFIIASVTDWADGFIARKMGLVTNFGKIMDPLADKVLVLSAFICLVPDERVAPWMAVVIIARELVIGSFRTIAASKGIVIAAGISGKVDRAPDDSCSPFDARGFLDCKENRSAGAVGCCSRNGIFRSGIYI